MKEPVKNSDAAFIMEEGDRFYRILLSDPICYNSSSNAETILCFYVIKRASGLIDIFNILKTFQGDKCVSRNVQSKLNIKQQNVEEELKAIMIYFSKGIKDATGVTINWNVLDLAKVTDKEKQIQLVNDWGISAKRCLQDEIQ